VGGEEAPVWRGGTRAGDISQLILMFQTAPRPVAVSTTAVVTQQVLSEPSRKAPRARPCRVSTADRKVRKGIMAYSLEDLLHKVNTV
jgi:hypothetical protein